MSLLDSESSIREDQRGVSELIGFLLIFAILIILLSINQAQIVPQENAEIEFKHSQDVQNDLIEVRSSILTAGQADVSQFPTVRLGTNYPTRTFALNPPPAVGTLRTSDAYPITIENNTGNSIDIDTRFLQYQPSYNELTAQPIWYENSVLYVDAREDGGVAVLAQQGLAVEENTLRITALQNDFQQSGTGRVTLELYPTQDVTADQIPTGDLTITLPTRLTAGEYWEQAIGSEDVYVDVTNNEYANGVHELELNINTTGGGELKLNTVGIQSEPSEGGQKQNVGSGGGGGNGGGDGGGGNGGGDAAQNVVIAQAQINNGDIVIQLRNNNPSQVQVTQARLDSYTEDTVPGGNRAPIDRVTYQPSTGAVLVEGDPLETVSGPTISNGGNADVTLSPQRERTNNNEIEEADAQQGDEIIFTLEFDDGSIEQYTITL